MVNDELLKEFITDTQSHLEGFEEDALKLEQDPARADLIDGMFRRIHSVKGNAGMLGFMAIHTAGQEFENFLDGVRGRRRATPGEMENIFRSIDGLKLAVSDLCMGKGFSAEAAPTVEETPAPSPAPAPVRPAAEPPAASEPRRKRKREDAAVERASEDGPKTFLTFTLGDERYGIDIMVVREIITTVAITRVPNTRRFVEGVMNLRDQVIPVFNLKQKLRVPVAEKNHNTSEKNIIVVEISKVATGLTVDDVTGIEVLPASEITPPAAFHGSFPTDYLHGVGRLERGAIILLEAMDLCNPAETLF